MPSFFMPMIPPTTTAQTAGINCRGRRPAFYDTPELSEARSKFLSALGQHRPEKPLQGAVRLITKWCFPIKGKHKDGEYKTSRPDTDNSLKLFKDTMTKLGYWKDDAQVASELTEKFWADTPGIWVSYEKIKELGG